MANQEKCQAVLDYLLAHPEQHCQRYWSRDWSKYQGWISPKTMHMVQQLYPNANLCGTTMCIAGTTMLLSGRLTFGSAGNERVDGIPYISREKWIEEAGKELGLTYPEADLLFMTMDNDSALKKLKEYANGE